MVKNRPEKSCSKTGAAAAAWVRARAMRKAKLHMARALIMNPEILIVEKPLMSLG